MLSQLKELYSLLTVEQRHRLVRLQGLVVLMGFAEVASVLAMGPFMSLVGDISRLERDGTLTQIYRASGFASPADFLFWMGVAVFAALALGAAISMFTLWRLVLYAEQLGAELSTRLYQHYMRQSWLFHASGSSTQLINRISMECNRVTQMLNHLLKINAQAVMAVFMIVVIIAFNPLVALVGAALFITAYVTLYLTVRMRLSRNSKTISQMQQQRFKLMNEGFGGIKDVLLLGRQADMNRRFAATSRRFGKARGVNAALGQVPRYAMQLLAFGSIILLVLYLLATYQGNLGTILPVLSIYALAGFKLLPAFQGIYGGISQIKANMSALDNIKPDLLASHESAKSPDSLTVEKLVPRRAISLKDVVFHYPNQLVPALDGVSLTIPRNQVIGLVGASGSGKSTAIDILLGLMEPTRGVLCIDGEPLRADQRRSWQNSLGFVPQAIFLADASIRENIAFGLSSEAIQEERVWRAARMAHLEQLLVQLPDGLGTRVGERGIQLSGGQRQRIGIARALYDDAEVLVLDEATSALDGITEKLVMNAIHDFSGNKTIIMIAHRLATVRQCDRIYLLDAGRVVDQGTYDELAARNIIFQRMTEHA
ncbi:ABC transporter ATP-binding protein [Halomonas sp. CS7]|uniref:ABC transporter ATP-binding protein n=1 Tax=Halomonas pelophila TaxID=3151122 RepID=A0ABV1NAA6_9GAMM